MLSAVLHGLTHASRVASNERIPQRYGWRRGPASGTQAQARRRVRRCGHGWRRSSSPARIAVRRSGQLLLLSERSTSPNGGDGYAQDCAFFRGLIRNGNCGICAGHAPWRLPASWTGMAHSAGRRQVRQSEPTNVAAAELWPPGRRPRRHGLRDGPSGHATSWRCQSDSDPGSTRLRRRDRQRPPRHRRPEQQ